MNMINIEYYLKPYYCLPYGMSVHAQFPLPEFHDVKQRAPDHSQPPWAWESATRTPSTRLLINEIAQENIFRPPSIWLEEAE